MHLSEQRLYYLDSYCTTFRAVVLTEQEQGETWQVQLDQTAFYPTSGGQPHDTGWLNDSRVLDVQVVDGQVIHMVDKSIGVGQTVEGRIDWDRRFDHMQHHTGQHILSAAFEQLMNADTIGFHLGAEVVTIDLDLPQLEVADVTRVEALANQIIWQNRTIQARFVDEQVLAGLSLRHPPKVEENIRIVSIVDFDDNACGGTHTKHTGEVGLLKILRTERMRGGIRLIFVCGGRALADYEHRNQVLKDLGSQLSTGVDELAEAVAKVQQSAVSSRKRMEAWKEKWLTVWARDTVARETHWLEDAQSGAGTGILCVQVEDLSEASDLQQAVRALVQAMPPTQSAVVAGVGELGSRAFIQAMSLTAPSLDVNAIVRSVLLKMDGKGGGTKQAAQGSFPVTTGTTLAQIVDWLQGEFRDGLS